MKLFNILPTEYHFYNGTIASMFPLSIPKCVFVDMNFTTGNGIFILEKVKGDFKNAVSDPPSMDQIRLVSGCWMPIGGWVLNMRARARACVCV
jgi:hypothetical protein